MLLHDKKAVGQIIKKHRKLKKLTQEELAETIGISEKHLGQIERGAFAPNIVNFFKIIQTLNINLEEFGVYLSESKNKAKENLIKEIYSLNSDELMFYIDLITIFKKNIKNKRKY